MSDEYESEPVPGLPEHLPQGETLIWQGSPKARSLLKHALLGRLIIAYFAVLAASVTASLMMKGATVWQAVAGSLHLAIIGALATGLLLLIAYLVQRTSLYTITSRRVVMRVGMALPMTLNIPFSKIASANLKLYSDGTGDLALLPGETLPVTYFHLWPHARGFKLRSPQPTLRSVAGARDVAEILVKAMTAAGVKGVGRVPAAVVKPELSVTPSGMPATA